MVNVKIDNEKKNLEIDGKKISIEEYNKAGYSYGKEDYFPKLDELIGISESDINILKDFNRLWAEFYGSEKRQDGSEYLDDEEQLRRLDKNGKVNRNIWAEIKNLQKETDSRGNSRPTDNKFPTIDTATDNEKTIKRLVENAIKKNNDWWQDNLLWLKTMVNKMKQLRGQKEETGNDGGNETPIQAPSKQEAEKLNQLREQNTKIIKNALNQSPEISNAELDNSIWENNIWDAISEKEINDIKESVLTDISIKRTAKKAQKDNKKDEWDNEVDSSKTETLKKITEALQKARLSTSDLSADCQNWREQIDQAAEKGSWPEIDSIEQKVLADIKNKVENKEQEVQKQKENSKVLADKFRQATSEEVNKMKDNELKEAMELFTRWEGESDFKEAETTPEMEKRLMANNPQLYCKTIVDAIKERIKDNELKEEELSEEVRNLIEGKITDPEKVKTAKEKAVKEIGDLGAKGKWTSLFNQAQALLKKAKRAVTEKVKEDIKAIQDQMKSLKTNSNTYLTSYYQNKKADVEKLEKDLASSLSSNQTGSPKKTPWGAIIPLSLVAVTLVAIVAVVVVRKRRKQAKK